MKDQVSKIDESTILIPDYEEHPFTEDDLKKRLGITSGLPIDSIVKWRNDPHWIVRLKKPWKVI